MQPGTNWFEKRSNCSAKMCQIANMYKTGICRSTAMAMWYCRDMSLGSTIRCLSATRSVQPSSMPLARTTKAAY
eukprot:TRINITY_DN5217_c0_g1_i1.p3 TRINITY_DN5217_c0_g1~~TRINITY_DN5217_c0_g1_i1.p3  ORF type:complete len:74 (+),score=0.31 TRINITY_DN5217_c0_g1_i1:149-370(+)